MIAEFKQTPEHNHVIKPSYSNILIPSASSRWKKKTKKRLWNTSNTWLKFSQIEAYFLEWITEYVDGGTENIKHFAAR